MVDFGIGGLSGNQTGNSLDYFLYGSPEQSNGLTATPASDVYSLGVIAYEMLTGMLPFTADTPAGIAARHLHEAPLPPSSLMPGISSAVDAAVLRCLEKDPARRFPTAGAFAEAMSFAASPTLQQPLRPPATPIVRSWSAEKHERHTAPLPGEDDPLSDAEIWPFDVLEDGGRQRFPWNRLGVGVAVALGLAALLLFGWQLAPRLADLNDDDDPGGFQAGATQQGTPSTTVLATSDGGEDGSLVRVPDLSGLSMAEAREKVLGQGLLFELRDPVFSETIPANAVAEQDPPAAASVQRGTSVVVKLSRGSGTVHLGEMDLVGENGDIVAGDLRQRGLGVTITERPDPEAPEGTVIETSPAGDVVVGDTVELVVSAGDADDA